MPTKRFLLPVLVAVTGLSLAYATGASPTTQQPPAADSRAAESATEGTMQGVPQTAQEHFARASSYLEKAAQYRAEAETHRKMFADYKKKQGSPALQNKMGREEPWVAKMRQHCETFIKAAENLAAEAERFAEFHRMRGEEMQGK